MKTCLCKCTNCDSILIDLNPQNNQSEFEIPENIFGELQYLDDENGGFFGCPVCETDAYLMDVDVKDITPINYDKNHLMYANTGVIVKRNNPSKVVGIDKIEKF